MWSKSLLFLVFVSLVGTPGAEISKDITKYITVCNNTVSVTSDVDQVPRCVDLPDPGLMFKSNVTTVASCAEQSDNGSYAKVDKLETDARIEKFLKSVERNEKVLKSSLDAVFSLLQDKTPVVEWFDGFGDGSSQCLRFVFGLGGLLFAIDFLYFIIARNFD